jgi:hypothetical protein
VTHEPPPLTRVEPIDGWTGRYARLTGVTLAGPPEPDGARRVSVELALDGRVDLQRVLAMIGAVLTGLDRQAAAELADARAAAVAGHVADLAASPPPAADRREAWGEP